MRFPKADLVGYLIRACYGRNMAPLLVRVICSIDANFSTMLSVGCHQQRAIGQLNAAMNRVGSGSGIAPGVTIV